MANGWTQDINGTDDDQDWRVDNNGTGSSNTGPSQDHDPGTSDGLYLFTEASGCNNQISNLVSPMLDFSGMSANANLDFTITWPALIWVH